jgi:predicted nucleic acid-binding protein
LRERRDCSLPRQRYYLIFDSSSIIVLWELGVLAEIFKRLSMDNTTLRAIIPLMVYEELSRGRVNIGQLANVIQIMKFSNDSVAIQLPEGLGEGEKEAILLALSMKNACRVIVITDDLKARRTCEKLGIEVLGSFGLIELLKRYKVISKNEALTLIEKILSTSLRIKTELLHRARYKIETQKL